MKASSYKPTPHLNSWLAGNAVGDLISLESSWTIVFQDNQQPNRLVRYLLNKELSAPGSNFAAYIKIYYLVMEKEDETMDGCGPKP